MTSENARREKRRKGLVIVFTGDGKGKTTAAMGLALRAAGNRMHVRVIQFIKGTWKTGEVDAAKALAPHLEIVRAGRGFTIERLRDPRIANDEHVVAAQSGMVEAREAITSPSFDVVVLDEILGAITAKLVTLEQVIALIEAKPPQLHLVLTGRGAPAEIIDRADLVTEMRLIKHPYQQGVIAQRGVEFLNPPIFAQAPVLAFSFLTVLPLRTGAIAASAFPRAVAYFPLVGFVIGVAVECLDLVLSLALPASLAAALDLTALAIITGGLHLDGLADTADGLLMRGGQQERLAVMREPRVGAFAIAAIVLLLLIEYAALFALAPAERRLGLIAGATLARWAMAVALWQFPYARASGVGFAFKSGLRGSEVAVATLITAVVVLGLGWRALAAASIGLAFALVLGRAATRTLGGLTGDVYGATGELVFAATLISWAAVR